MYKYLIKHLICYTFASNKIIPYSLDWIIIILAAPLVEVEQNTTNTS